MKRPTQVNSFKFAIAGLKYAFSTQVNMWIHLGLSVTAVLLALYLKLERIEWLILILTITLVFTAELFNTALESVTDLMVVKYHRKAKNGKDTAAGAVLSTAVGALIIGLVLFLGH